MMLKQFHGITFMHGVKVNFIEAGPGLVIFIDDILIRIAGNNFRLTEVFLFQEGTALDGNGNKQEGEIDFHDRVLFYAKLGNANALTVN